MRFDPGPAASDEGQDRDQPTAKRRTGAGAGLERQRRQTRWSSLAIVYGLGAFGVASVAATEPFGPVTVIAVVAAVAGSLAAGRLVDRRITATTATAGTDDKAVDGPLVAVAVAAGLAYAVVAQFGEATAFRDVADDAQASWFAVPAVANIAVVVALTRHRSVVAALLGAVVATVVAAAAGLVAVGNVAWGWFAVEGALVAGVGVAARAELRHWELVVGLEHARRLEGELAVAQERLRFAADLHDIQGHHLQVIALESELATRLTVSDPAAATTHMTRAGDHARQALADTRSVVQGYRRASLAAELANATRVLNAAGIDGHLDNAAQDAADDLAEPARHLLGLVVREATTNVLRHSNADQARLTLTVDDDTARLEVRNNGARATGKIASRDATGLATLADRLDAAGGTLTWDHRNDWFTVAAHISTRQEQPP